MVDITYRTAQMRGKCVRYLYHNFIPFIVHLPIQTTCKVGILVYSFSCERDLPEQIASIRSFIQYVGIPNKFTVISDGSYSQESQKLLRQINPCIDVVHWKDIIKSCLPQAVLTYANSHPLGKKIAILMSLAVNQVTIYTDSDILYFPGAKEIIQIANSDDLRPRYLPDCCFALDERLLLEADYNYHPVNTGFLIIREKLNWNLAIERLLHLKENPHYFTEQTMVHLTMHNNQALPLDVNRYLVRLDDQITYQDKYASTNIALRHYVTPIRHKFWYHVKI